MDEGLFVLVTLVDTSGEDDLLTDNMLFLVAEGTEFEPSEAAGYRPSLALPLTRYRKKISRSVHAEVVEISQVQLELRRGYPSHVREDLRCDWDAGGRAEDHSSSSAPGISFHASIIRLIDSRTTLTLSNLLALKKVTQEDL
uniref:Uncharacterized protein n=1 Tax=Zea mays TaxID=4577 RepID=C0P3P3_MAIZE|nr:unknown [Zea mays]